MKLVAIVAERLGARLPVTAAFEYPTVEQMALHVEPLREEEPNSVQYEEGVLEQERS